MRRLFFVVLIFLGACTGSNPPPPAVHPVDGGSSPDAAVTDQATGAEQAADQGAGGETSVPSAPAYVIDDMERSDRSQNFVSPAGVLGSWYAKANFADGLEPLISNVAIIQPVGQPVGPVGPQHEGDSKQCAYMLAPALEDGADLYLDFHPGTTKGPDFNHVDFSAYTGIAFWARASLETELIVAIKDDQLAVDNQEFWFAELVGTHWFSVRRAAGPQWQHVAIPFASFAQGLGSPGTGALHPNAIGSIHFVASPHVPFDLAVDDLVLTCNGPCPGMRPSDNPAAAAVCEPSFAASCNDNPAISSIHGTCQPNGTCLCGADFARNPATGKCL